mmetsp:Transcript_15116/g.41844  ORF Transcript_15116/g.41844 Transcript_15116/m.41844 type:complete len:181 (-) Transcript_15116:321-863(-)|eukprot:CAMPEP_0198121884 /NCGR_PEP_ID=MMETSP1442-20131203/33334_1 /TAXON_ID= /ORGANISM="Craspedostauros australis, Strain CCMP3328" /LENGTH=180 /DNA_ID=CAMNT_0043780773 /DNA_START=157 /DNA_END=699 /DNA_ORIENTATION=-
MSIACRLTMLFAIAAVSVSAFVPSFSTSQTMTRTTATAPTTTQQRRAAVARLLAIKQNGENDDFPSNEGYEGSVDWDAEWKKVVDNKDESSTQRPGKDFYKSDAEIAAIKATNTAAERAAEVSYKVQSSLPSMGSLTGDWKFWIGVLAIISIGISVLTAPSGVVVPPADVAGASADSYFI